MQQTHPKRSKHCAYCNYWVGDAKLKYINNNVGFEYDNNANGKCIRRSGSITRAGSSCDKDYEPNQEAKKIL